MSNTPITLFPLNAHVFPRGRLSLRIFEPRYLDMVSQCSKTEAPFAVCLIESGREAGEVAELGAASHFAPAGSARAEYHKDRRHG